MKKLLALLMSILIVFTGLVGCKSSDDGLLSQYKNRPKEVIVYYSANAYGQDWIVNIAEKYMSTHNTDTYINIKKTVTQTEDLSRIEAGGAPGDLYMLDCHLEEKTFAYENISDVYDSYPIGETEKKISQKIEAPFVNYYKNSGASDYIMPKTSILGGYNFAYNKTILDTAFPEGYTLPRTTNEFIELGSKLKDHAYLMISSFGDSTDYGIYLYKAWFAQLIGFEAFENFCDGRYYDEVQEKYVFNETEPTFFATHKEELQEYYEIVKGIYLKENDYTHSNSLDMGAMDAEAVLSGIGYGENPKLGAFMIQGAYVEQEMGWMLESQKSAGKEQEIRMMQTPVASGIIKRTPSIETEDELRVVIDYVDKILAGETAEKPANVDDKDIEIIKEARTICGT